MNPPWKTILRKQRKRLTCFSDGQIKKALSESDKVEIRNFGALKIKEYKGYTGRNPKTGEQVKVQPKKLPVFKPGKELKKRVSGLSN